MLSATSLDDRSPMGEQDLIWLVGELSFSHLVFRASGDDVVITSGGTSPQLRILLEGYLVDHEMGDLTADDFLFGG